MHGMQLPGLQGTSPKHSPGRHFNNNKEPENFTISVRKGKLQQPHKQQPVSAEAHPQGKAWRSSAGFRSWSFMPQQGQLWTWEPRPQHGHSRCHRSSRCHSTAVSSGRTCRKPAGKTSPEPCSRTQDLRENCVLSPPLDAGPCGFPQCVKS